MYNTKTILLAFILIGLVSLGSWLSIRHLNLSPTPANQVREVARAAKVKVVKMNPNGQLHYQMTLSNAVNYSNNHDQSDEVDVLMYSDQKGTPPWHIRAPKGWMVEGHQVKLYNGVVITRAKYSTHPAFKMTTSVLYLNPKTSEAYTDAPVTLSQPQKGNITHAVGLRANLDQKYLELLSNVSSVYEPNKK